MKIGNKIILIALLMSLQSCGVFKSVFKESNKEKESVEMEISKEVDTIIEDSTRTIITEKIKTIVNIPSKQIESNTPVLDLSAIKDLIVVTNDLLDVVQTYDTLSRNLKTIVYMKALHIPVEIDKTTIINNDIVTKTKFRLDSNIVRNTVVKEKIKTEKPVNVIWLVVLGLGVLVTGYFLTRKIF